MLYRARLWTLHGAYACDLCKSREGPHHGSPESLFLGTSDLIWGRIGKGVFCISKRLSYFCINSKFTAMRSSIGRPCSPLSPVDIQKSAQSRRIDRIFLSRLCNRNDEAMTRWRIESFRTSSVLQIVLFVPADVLDVFIPSIAVHGHANVEFLEESFTQSMTSQGPPAKTSMWCGLSSEKCV